MNRPRSELLRLCTSLAPSRRRPLLVRRRALALKLTTAALAAAVAIPAATLLGQAAPARGGRSAAQPPAPAAPAQRGLDGLSDDVLMNELAARGLESLLNRLFDENKVSAAEREGFQSLRALRELGAAASLGNADRIRLMRDATTGLQQLLPKMTDPFALRSHAATLISKGIEPDVDTLDYWGANSSIQSRLYPAAHLAVEMLQKAAKIARDQASVVENMIKAPGDPASSRWEQLFALANQAGYVAAISSYYEAVAVDVSGENKTGWEQRRKIVDPSIKYLTEFDTPGSGVAALVKMSIGKQSMIKGDFNVAKRYFQAVIDGKTVADGKTVDLDPPPTMFQQSDARYFAAVCDVTAGQPEAAAKSLEALNAWQKKSLDAADLSKEGAGARAAIEKRWGAQAMMLQYRIASAQAEKAKDPATKSQFNAAADTTLTKLGTEFPQFQPLITELLVTRLPDDADLSKQGLPLLQAVISKAEAERNKPEKAPFDRKLIDRGLAAAKLIAGMKPGVNGVTPDTIETANIMVPLLLQKQGNLLDASSAYLDYATNDLYKNRPNAAKAVDTGTAIAVREHLARPNDAATSKLYARALAIAANPPFERKEAFYAYGKVLLQMGDAKQAIVYLRKVGKGERNETDARYLEVVAEDKILDGILDIPSQQQQASKMITLIAAIKPLLQKDIAAARAANDAGELESARFQNANITLIAADLALKKNDAKQALALLGGFDQQVEGMKSAAVLRNRASFLKTTANLASGNINEAVSEVQQLASNPQTASVGIDLATNLLNRLGTDFESATASGDRKRMSEIASNRAKLTGFLIPFAHNHKDPAWRNREMEFVIYDAEVKRKAGELQDDPKQKQALLQEAIKVYTQARDKVAADASLQARCDFGLAAARFELGDYAGASAGFGSLIRDGKVGNGSPSVRDEATGGYVVKDNPVYWEAMSKWLRSNVEVAKQKPGDPQSKTILDGVKSTLRSQFITYGDRTGGDQFAKPMNALRQEMLGDWKPTAAAPSPAAASQPGASQPGASQPASSESAPPSQSAASRPAATQPSSP